MAVFFQAAWPSVQKMTNRLLIGRNFISCFTVPHFHSEEFGEEVVKLVPGINSTVEIVASISHSLVGNCGLAITNTPRNLRKPHPIFF